ncbi:MAG TPA: hypothetical protein PLP80_10285, partial [Niabella sp.]|nr:hypothetical protein [Niabella sp.]
AQLSIWENPVTGVDPGQSNPYQIGDNVNSDITVSGIGRGTGVNGANANNRYNTSSWNTESLDQDAYLSFTLTPNAGKKINFHSFEYTGQTSGTGPTSFVFRHSVDNFASDIGSPIATGTTIDLSTANFQNITSPITFCLYAFGASSSGGTFSINDFKFTGTVVLPIHFGTILAFNKGDLLHIHWTTLKETNNSHFEIQASRDGEDFKTIKTISSQNGNTDNLQHYESIISIHEVNAVFAIPLILGLLSVGYYQRKRKWLALLALIVAFSQFLACNKSGELVKQTESGKIFIRIRQVDADGMHSYSKIVQSIRQ